jgi:hypothetical protein
LSALVRIPIQLVATLSPAVEDKEEKKVPVYDGPDVQPSAKEVGIYQL